MSPNTKVRTTALGGEPNKPMVVTLIVSDLVIVLTFAAIVILDSIAAAFIGVFVTALAYVTALAVSVALTVHRPKPDTRDRWLKALVYGTLLLCGAPLVLQVLMFFPGF